MRMALFFSWVERHGEAYNTQVAGWISQTVSR